MALDMEVVLSMEVTINLGVWMMACPRVVLVPADMEEATHQTGTEHKVVMVRTGTALDQGTLHRAREVLDMGREDMVAWDELQVTIWPQRMIIEMLFLEELENE